jgi:hypothetical protein
VFLTKVVEKIKTHILRSVPFFSENHAMCEIMFKIMVESYRPQMTVLYSQGMSTLRAG